MSYHSKARLFGVRKSGILCTSSKKGIIDGWQILQVTQTLHQWQN